MIRFYKDGDSFAFETDIDNWNIFIDEISKLIEKLIDKGDFDNDWHFQFSRGLIPLLIKTYLYYQGKNKNVYHKTCVRVGENLKIGLIIEHS